MILKDDFVKSLENCVGFEADSFQQAHQMSPAVSIRINHKKTYVETLMAESTRFNDTTVLNKLNQENTVPWCNEGYYLDQRPVFTLDPLIHAGAYYVQEASSMFIDHALKIALEGRSGLNALDLCAAPGGKTTLLANLPHFKLLLANEIIQSRVSSLYENVVKWGNDHVFVSNNDPRDIGKLTGFFDVILVDAPCSGSGLFRKDPAAMDQWNQDLVSFCSVRQKRILDDIYPSLAEKGVLVYSTCSYSFEENEANLDMLLHDYGLESIRIPIQAEWGIVESQSPVKGGFGYRFYPDKVKGEGFFCAVLIKKETTIRADFRSKRLRTFYKSENLKAFLQNPDHHACYLHEKDVFAVKVDCFDDFTMLQDYLSLKRSGLRLGSLVRDELLPDHELAMSNSKYDGFPFFEVREEMALKYLRKQDMGMEVEAKGWMLVKFKGIALGWVKSIPRRMNNYYPINWRILMRE